MIELHKKYLFAFIFLLSASQIFACFCSAPELSKEYYNETDLIFLGKLVGATPVYEEENSWTKEYGRSIEEYILTYKIIENFKHDTLEKHVTIRVSYGSCGIDFKAREKMLVYAILEEDGKYRTNSCERTGFILKDDQEQKKELETLRSYRG